MALKNQKGITLIEMIVFIVVAAVALPVIVSPVMTLLKDSMKPERAVTANFLGQQKLETITKNNYTSITIEEVAYAPVTGFTDYQWYWKTEWVDSALNSSVSDVGYIKITVKVKDPDNTEYIYYTLATKRVNDV
ncbi:MAG: type II secretion system GspH family protein [Proteobacteria bacterium]|nr:type II secretion system GspH family protein [Pseudomonadota bacterium]MCG2758262.1 type II secretion system GspH family protein [Desulfobacteraceae bacterium]